MKFAIIGCRHPHIGVFVDEMIGMGHGLLGIAEREGPLAPRLAAQYGVPLFEDAEELLALNPEVVGTSDVNDRKIDIVERCAARNIPVMADKPIVTSRDGYARLQAVAGRIRVGMLLTERYNPALYTLRNRIQGGELGRLVSITATKPHKLNAPSREPWHFSTRENGGAVVDLMVHDFDLLRWLTGSEVDTVHGAYQQGGVAQHPEFIDSALAVVAMECGVTASLQVDWWTPQNYWCFGDGRLTVTGTKGFAEVFTNGRSAQSPEPALFINTDGTPVLIENDKVPGCISQDFLDGIENPQRAGISNRDILMASLATLDAFEPMMKIQKG